MHLGDLIEEAIKNNAKEDNAENNVDLDLGEDSNIEDIERSLQDKDFEDYNDFLD
jgi:hypothetical protein